METTCYECGNEYELYEEYEIDTWNVGHYGCTMDNAPRRLKGYKDIGCYFCRENKIKRKELLKEKEILEKHNVNTEEVDKQIDELNVNFFGKRKPTEKMLNCINMILKYNKNHTDYNKSIYWDFDDAYDFISKNGKDTE